MDKIFAILDTCTNIEQMETFYNFYLMKTARDEHQVWMIKGAYEFKLMQMKSAFEKTYKRERFPCTDEQPLQQVGE